MNKIMINVCLSDIPSELTRTVETKDGTKKFYVNLMLADLREKDEHGNDMTVKVYVPKDKRDKYERPVYVGRGKTLGDTTGDMPDWMK